MIMQDRETESFWSHLTGESLEGKMAGTRLAMLPSVQTTWELWVKEHPNTKVLRKEQEVRSSRYERYFEDPDRMGLFRAQWLVDRMPGKTLVFGAVLGSHALAVTEGVFENAGPVMAELGDITVALSRRPEGGVRAFAARVDDEEVVFSTSPATGKVLDAGGSTWDLGTGGCIAGPRLGARLEMVPVTPVYWFAWSSFYPNTMVIAH